MMAPIPTDEPDPLRRLSVTHATLASAKTVHQAIPATILQDTGQFIPPALLARASRVAMSALSRAPLEPPCNVVISNVPGSPVPLYFAGATMLAHYPISAIAHSCGLNITVLSYQDRLDVGVAADRNQTPNAWRVVETLEDALAELTASLPASRTI
jgi:hypothetical protein